jgi:hypothetical protein
MNTKSRNAVSAVARFARRTPVTPVLLMLASESYGAIGARLGSNPNCISRWKRRREADGLEWGHANHYGQPPTERTPAMEARILEKTG